MAYISFITTYRPIVCGIADYTEFITRVTPPEKWNVLSFDLDNYGVSLGCDSPPLTDRVQYTIPGRNDYSARDILSAIKPCSEHVLWFQHEFGIWRDDSRFVNMLQNLDRPKVVTPHSLHFQSDETAHGLRRHEYDFLRSLLPCVDAITVFSDGVYRAVIRAFPEHSKKVHVLRHGTHVYRQLARTSRMEAKKRIHSYLMNTMELDSVSKRRLSEQRIFVDPNVVVIGGTGFITANKGIELLGKVRNILQEIMPSERIAAVYIGFLREPDSDTDRACAIWLRDTYKDGMQFFLELYLPIEILPIFMRAMDIYFYWPHDCTQSGIIAHALGAGATIACREMEGVGETVRIAGGLTSSSLGQLINGIEELILNPEERYRRSMDAARFAERFSWGNQARQHFDLAETICLKYSYPLAIHTSIGAGTVGSAETSVALRDELVQSRGIRTEFLRRDPS
ncbi:MAG: hypothetical protein JSW38_03370 [Dehalococcoidia bacterium]|nr:MAG: hypothetical protein JSW38_03370 [Dehalococcoidia bacterium]